MLEAEVMFCDYQEPLSVYVDNVNNYRIQYALKFILKTWVSWTAFQREMELLNRLGDLQVAFYLPLHQFLDINSKGEWYQTKHK